MRNPRILKIINIEPFKIETLWTNGDVRLIDFTDKLPIFSENERYKPLLDFETFSKVEVGEGDTLCWQNLQYKTTKGNLSPLAFDPDVLFAKSQLLEPKPIIEIDTNHEFTQAEYARRNGINPAKVRTWVRRGRLKSRYVPHLDITLVVV
jgi:hypothetical protein